MHRTTTHTCAALAALTLSAAAMAQGTMTFFWAAGDSGNNDGIIEPGESLVATLYAELDPMQIGFAGSIFEIAGNTEWQAGTIQSYDNFLDDLTDDGDLQGDNTITDIEAFQLPPFFNPQYIHSNPIALYQIVWTPEQYRYRSIEFFSQNHQNASVYTDNFGTSVEYDIVIFGGQVSLVPAPTSTVVLGLCGLPLLRRRR